MNKKLFINLSLLLFFLLFSAESVVKAQNSPWYHCPDGEAIVRCETYNCPNGDTNKDGACTKEDQGASLTDARSDALCANPPSNCGEVHYYPKNATLACSIRVKEGDNNCNLYSAGNPQFATPTPAPTKSPSPSPTPTISPTPTGTPKPGFTVETKGGQTLPETGPDEFLALTMAALGFLGLFLYEKSKSFSKNS